MKSIRPLYLVLLCLPLLASCALISGSAKHVTQDEYDAWLIYKKGNELLKKNQTSVAEAMFIESYNKFTLLDNQTGKLQALAGLAKVYSVTDVQEKKLVTLEKLRILSDAGMHDNGEYKLALTELYLIENKPDSILITLDGYSFNSENENHVLMLVYKLNAGISLKRNIASETIILEKLLQQYAEKDLGDLKNPMLPGFGFYTLALAKMYQKDFVLSERYALLSLDFDRKSSNSGGIADDYQLLGDIFRLSGQENKAYPSYIRAAEIYKLLNLELDGQITAIKVVMADTSLTAASKRALLKKMYTETKYPVVKQKVLDLLGPIE